MSDARVKIVITADGANAKAALDDVKRQIGGVGPAGQAAGQAAGGGMDLIGAAASRLLPLLGAGGVAGAIMGVARAGDAMTSSLGRLQAATGSIQAAADSYNQLYRISLQTGVAVNDAAAAFSRFAIAAQDIGATREQVTQLVRLMQQAGTIGGASAAETAAATQQLGQALASGKLQGDELRSIMENMPNLAQALARELGVGIGELRKMGEEGRLTASTVFPALLRAAESINREFERLPLTMARGFAQLGVATTRFVADLDQAVGLSQRIAAAAASAAASLDRARRANFGTPTEQGEERVRTAGGRVRELERTVANTEGQLAPGGPDRETRNLVGQERQSAQRGLELQRRQLAEARAELQAAERQVAFAGGEDGPSRAAASSGEAMLGRFTARDRAQSRIQELRDQLDPRIGIRREAEERRTRARDDGATAGTDQADINRLLGQIAADERRALEAADKRERGPQAREDRRPERLASSIAVIDASVAAEGRLAQAIAQGGVAARIAEADQKALIEATRLYPQGGAAYEQALTQLTAGHRALSAAQAEGRAAQLALTDSQTAAEQAMQASLIGASAIDRARRTAEFARRRELDRAGIDPESERGRSLIAGAANLAEQRVELERNQATYNELGRIGEQAFNRIGQAATSGTLSLKSLGDIGKSVISELTQAFFQLSLINPLKNAFMGGKNPTIGDVGGIFGRLLGLGGGGSLSGSATSAATYAPVGGGIEQGFAAFGLHSGGIVGREATFTRHVNDNLFANARRYHQGGMIGADEVPAILQRGEGVFTAEQMARLGPAGGGGSTTINMPIQFSGDSGSAADRAGLMAAVEMRVLQLIDAKTPEIARTSHQFTLAEVSRGGASARALGRR